MATPRQKQALSGARVKHAICSLPLAVIYKVHRSVTAATCRTWCQCTPILDSVLHRGDRGSLNLEEKGFINGSKEKWAQMTSDKLKEEALQLKLLGCNTPQSGKCV
jgi:hypothetical protein